MLTVTTLPYLKQTAERSKEMFVPGTEFDLNFKFDIISCNCRATKIIPISRSELTANYSQLLKN